MLDTFPFLKRKREREKKEGRESGGWKRGRQSMVMVRKMLRTASQIGNQNIWRKSNSPPHSV